MEPAGGGVTVDARLGPYELLERLRAGQVRPGDHVPAAAPIALWERLAPWKARQVRALERIAAALEQQQR